MSAFECSFPLPHFAVSILGDEKSIDSSSLSSIRGDKAMVVDFWHSKCKWCPPALEKLNKEAGCADSDDIIFVSCALSQGEGDYEVASNLVTKGSHKNMTHLFLDAKLKDAAKKSFGFATVPFCIIVDKKGNIVAKGQPMSMNYKELLRNSAGNGTTATAVGEVSADAAKPVSAALKNVFTLEEDF